MMRHLDVFSGIGGWALGASWTGRIQTIGFCEIESFPRLVLAAHWPGVPIHDDVRTLTGDIVRGWGGADLITASYPCQGFSIAGQRRGEADDRFLWPEVARLVEELQPAWLCCENVDGHISLGLDRVLADLEGLGYESWTCVLPAVAVNAPHIRKRVWIIAFNSRRQKGTSSDCRRNGLREIESMDLEITQQRLRIPNSAQQTAGDKVDHHFDASACCAPHGGRGGRSYQSGQARQSETQPSQRFSFSECAQSDRCCGSIQADWPEQVAGTNLHQQRSHQPWFVQDGRRGQGCVSPGKDQPRTDVSQPIIAHRNNGQRTSPHHEIRTGRNPVADGGEPVAHRDSSWKHQLRGLDADQWGRPGNPRTVAPDATGQRQPGPRQPDESRHPQAARVRTPAEPLDAENVAWRAQSGMGLHDDGLSGGLAGPRAFDRFWQSGIPPTIPARSDALGQEKITGLGNAILPQIAYEILDAIIESGEMA